MRWIVDTSAWARRDVPAVKASLSALVKEGDELILSPVVLIELLRAPQGEAVAELYAELTATMQLLQIDDATFELAFMAMEDLAMDSPEGHRLPVTDLVTAALAHQHECGVLHLDRDYEAIPGASRLEFPAKQVCDPDNLIPADAHGVAGTQRRLKKEHGQLLHQLPVAEAERLLQEAVARAREAVGRQRRPGRT